MEMMQCMQHALLTFQFQEILCTWYLCGVHRGR